MNQRYFITGTGTDIGKTFITAALLRQAKAIGKSAAAYKPVITGFDMADCATSDSAILLQAMDQAATPENINRISPFHFGAPLAPSMAARLENRALDFDKLVEHSRRAMNSDDDIVLIEGVGGVMVPLTQHHTTLEWIEAIESEAILVAGNYLGSLSHTLTALHVLMQRDIPVFAIIISESKDSPVSMSATVDELARWTRLPIVPVPRRNTPNAWMDIKELRPLVD